jgi:crotonobetaine/carnitine-CoA ligase
MFTSGTTGRSKGVIKQTAADYFSARGLLEVVSATAGKPVESLSEDTFFSCLPLFHSNAQVLSGYPALVAGGRVAYVERFSSSRFWQQVIDAEATIFNSIGAVSYFIWNIPESDLDRAHKVHTCFAAPAPKDIYNEFQERFGVKFIEGYGLTETGMATYMDPTRPAVAGSMGKANPGYEVTIVEPGTDRPLAPETPGEIVVDMKIPNIVMRAYYGMPEKTAEDFRNLKLHTGDLGRMDADGYFYFMDRVKDYIRRRGENVSSMEVERQASDHPNIKEAAAIGVKAGEGASSEDEIMIVCIAEGEPPDPADYTHWMAERMPYFMVPRYIRFVDQLPKTPTERVQKVKLRDEGITPDTFDREAAGITIKR